jgi:polyisoprenoid-binding protein YceI
MTAPEDDHDSSGSPLAEGVWRLDPQRCAVEFTSRTMWGAVPVKGSFTNVRGHLDLARDPAIELVIDAASISTHNAKRDAHLRSSDFLNAAAHPEIRFQASEVEVHGDHLHVHGELAVAGTSVTIEPMTHLHPVGDEMEIDAVARVNLRTLGMSGGPGGMIHAKAWLSVRGRLVREA